jgi:GTP-binding protein HflX
VLVSARTGEGLDELRRRLDDALPRPDVEVRALVPYARGDLVSRVHREGDLLAPAEHTEEGTLLHARVSKALAADLAPFAA